jgi:hypothetical protein
LQNSVFLDCFVVLCTLYWRNIHFL